MKSALVTSTAMAAALMVMPAVAQECVNADPGSVLSGVQGDFEVILDPQDPQQNLVFVANVTDGRSSVIAAHIDGKTGQVVAGSRTTLATNFHGRSSINGPEFVLKPTGELGVLYAGQGGVRAIFRSATPGRWDAFRFDVAGNRVVGNPPLLPSTSPGAYPAPPLPLGQDTFGQYRGDCTGVCYGQLGSAATLDGAAVLASLGLTPKAAIQGSVDGLLYFSACAASGSCGLYEARLDGAGSYVESSFQMIAATGATAPSYLGAAQHPVTGSTVLFSNHGRNAIDVWEHQPGGGALRLVRRVSVTDSAHYRVETDGQELVLHYVIKSGANIGSYTIPVGVVGAVLNAGGAKKVSNTAVGLEIAWMPAAGRWAAFFPNAEKKLRRCWITP